MEIPSVPTDDLHKFRAVLGLIGFFATLLLVGRFVLGAQNKVFDTLAEVAKLRAERDIFDARLSRLPQGATPPAEMVAEWTQRQVMTAVINVRVKQVGVLMVEDVVSLGLLMYCLVASLRVAKSGFSGWAALQVQIDKGKNCTHGQSSKNKK